jgi:hypothetical protein
LLPLRRSPRPCTSDAAPVYDLIRTGQLRSLKIGKLRRIPVDAVHEFARRMLDEEGDAA